MEDIKQAMAAHRAQFINLLISRGVKSLKGRPIENITYSELVWELENTTKERMVNYDRRCALYSLSPL